MAAPVLDQQRVPTQKVKESVPTDRRPQYMIELTHSDPGLLTAHLAHPGQKGPLQRAGKPHAARTLLVVGLPGHPELLTYAAHIHPQRFPPRFLERASDPFVSGFFLKSTP